MESLNIPIDAKNNFDLKAHKLIDLIKEIPSRPSNNDFQPDHYMSSEINLDEQIDAIEMGYVDHTGKEVGKSFYYEHKKLGLINADYVEFTKLAGSVYKSGRLKKVISAEFIKKELFSWLSKSYKEKSKTSFIEHFLPKAESSIQHHEIWIPIPYTIAESEFLLGRITFKPITHEQMDTWFGYWKSEDTNKDEGDVEKYKNKLRHDYQGYVAGVYECSAERTRAHELAYYYVAQSLAVLRLLSPANHLPSVVCGASEFGGRMQKTKEYFIISRSRKEFQPVSELLDLGLRWTISNMEIGIIKNSAFANYHVLLNCDSPNEYQKKLLEALLIYSRNTISRDLYEKILYILIALESILLRNDNEPIQQNIGDRMAFAIGKNTSERRQIVSVLKAVYAVRSKYIHQGIQAGESWEMIQAFMQYAFLTFDALVRHINIFKTKEECINSLEHVKYS